MNDDTLVVWATPSSTLQEAASLSPAEERRAGTFRRAADRARFVSTTYLLKAVVAARLGCRLRDVPLQRRCGCGVEHGRPTVPGTDLHVSMSHSGSVVGVALSALAPIGLDVQHQATGAQLSDDLVLAPDERGGTRADFWSYWTRKEALVKATGDGLSVALSEVRVTPPSAEPRCVGYPGRDVTGWTLLGLEVAPDYSAAVALLTCTPQEGLTERWVHLEADGYLERARPRDRGRSG